MARAKKRGRPKLAATKKRSAFVTVRVTAAERKKLERAADGLPVATWARYVLLRAAKSGRFYDVTGEE